MGQRFITDEEKALWDLVNQTTKRLEKREEAPEPTKKPKKIPVCITPSLISFDSPTMPSRKHKEGIDILERRTSRKIRKQSLTIDARLDLHGCIQKDAHAKLLYFIKSAYLTGHTLVLIITGKGFTKQKGEPWATGEPGVLRKKLPEWIKDPALFPEVLSISQAQVQDGGQGAYYVFLKKKRYTPHL